MKIFLPIILLITIAPYSVKAQTISFGFTRTATATTQTLTLAATASANIPNNAWSTGRLALRIPISAMTGSIYPPSSYGSLGIGNPDPNFTSVYWGTQTGIAQWSDLGMGPNGITTFVPSDFGAPNDGYVYIFTNYPGSSNGPMASGVPVTILQFTVPVSWNCANGGGSGPCVQILDASFNSVPWIFNTVGAVDLSISQASVCGGSCNIATIGSSGPLPIKLNGFTAQPDGCSTKIAWTSDAETGLDHYDLQYSTDAANFTTISKVTGKGDGSYYTLTDPQPNQGRAYYRLAIVNQIGQIEYSPIVTLKINCQGTGASAVVYPNPVDAGQGIKVAVQGFKGNIYGSLYSNLGSLISKNQLHNGANTINTSQLAAGIYMLNITDEDGNTTVQKIIITR